MATLLNYADAKFRDAQRFNSKTGLAIGGFDAVFESTKEKIAPDFYTRNQLILDVPRGGGYWLWKPYFIVELLSQIKPGELIFYCDAASHFIHSAKPLLELPALFNQDVIPFELDLIERQFTKERCAQIMGLDGNSYELTKQRLASYFVIRKSPMSVEFMQEFLKFACNYEVISDAKPDEPNYADFVSHRNDQSIFSLLTKKYGLQAFRDPSQWGNKQQTHYPNSSYPQIIEHTRQASPKQARWYYQLKHVLRR